MKIKIEIKHWINGSVLFELEKEDNTIKETLEKAVKQDADLQDADLRGANLQDANLQDADLQDANLQDADLRGANLQDANLQDADLRGANLQDANLQDANLRGANLRGAYLRGANLRGANLRGANLQRADLQGADLQGADLRGAKLYKLPADFINQCSRDILFILTCLKDEVPHLKKMLLEGKVNGTQYGGDCACLIGTLANGNGGIEKVCKAIPFYEKGTQNMGETWFLNIREGDTPETNQFSAHVLKLIEMVESGNMHTIVYEEPNK